VILDEESVHHKFEPVEKAIECQHERRIVIVMSQPHFDLGAFGSVRSSPIF
jgi:hypothetical protein